MVVFEDVALDVVCVDEEVEVALLLEAVSFEDAWVDEEDGAGRDEVVGLDDDEAGFEVVVAFTDVEEAELVFELEGEETEELLADVEEVGAEVILVEVLLDAAPTADVLIELFCDVLLAVDFIDVLTDEMEGVLMCVMIVVDELDLADVVAA